ncbi:MAG: hypothetical protein ACI4IJ_03055 [Acutalibacteraceae bacterium]
MSATVAAALKKISAGLLSEPKIFKKVVSIILVLLIAVLTPIMAVVAVLNSDIEIGTDELESIIQETLSEEQKAQLAGMQSTMNSIESRMNDAGYASRSQEAQVLYVLALSDRTSDSGFVEKLVGCFSDNQTDAQLVNSVNQAFGTSISVEDFSGIMNRIRAVYIDTSDYIDPSTKNNLDLVKWAVNAEKSGWGYVWGTYGGVLNRSLLNRKIKQYPDEVGSMSEFIERNWLGGRTADCVGLIKGYGWLNAETHQVEYGTNGMLDVSADQMYRNAKEKGLSSTMPEIPGLAVWRKGHIGIYIGNGEVIEAMGTKYGVVKTKFSAKRWTHWLKIPYISYIEESQEEG